MPRKSHPKEKITDLYNRVAADYGQIGPRVLDTFGQRLVELIDVSQESIVLDVASGRGASLFPGARAARLAVGSDLAFQMVCHTRQEAEKSGLTNIHMLQMDGDHLAFRAASIDIILCGFAMFFFLNPHHTLHEWSRVLKPGGKLGVCVASAGDERWDWYEELLVHYHRQYRFPLRAGGSDLRKPTDIKNRMADAGFSATEVIHESYEFVYADANQWWQAKWTHGARYPLENMSEEVLAQFKAEVFEHINQKHNTNDLREEWKIAYIIGRA
jgi:ubiquinone/menaquinone biosynthesis C-methylase UbiE